MDEKFVLSLVLNNAPVSRIGYEANGQTFRKQMRDTFIKGNEVYAGQKPNGTIARILKDQTWSEKYQKVVPRKGRYALLFQDVGGGGQVISFPTEQLKKALSDLKQQGYEQVTEPKRTPGHKPGSVTTLIPYSPMLRIVNIEALPRGTGAKYLLVIQGEMGELVAKQWKRQIPGKLNPREAIIDFRSRTSFLPSETRKDKPRSKQLPRKEQQRLLPSDAQDIQTLPFDSQMFDCYGKQTKRGFRAYCRRKYE